MGEVKDNVAGEGEIVNTELLTSFIVALFELLILTLAFIVGVFGTVQRNLSIEMRQIFLFIKLHFVIINQPERLVYLSTPDYQVF